MDRIVREMEHVNIYKQNSSPLQSVQRMISTRKWKKENHFFQNKIQCYLSSS